VSFRSGPKITTHIGPLLELVFWLFLGPGAVLGIATPFTNSARDALSTCLVRIVIPRLDSKAGATASRLVLHVARRGEQPP
jgi:hypothetical protein